jgi:hypothetical protein
MASAARRSPGAGLDSSLEIAIGNATFPEKLRQKFASSAQETASKP